jgi:hypothetical protein
MVEISASSNAPKRRRGHYIVQLPVEISTLAGRTDPIKLKVEAKRKRLEGFGKHDNKGATYLKIREIFDNKSGKRADRISFGTLLLPHDRDSLNGNLQKIVEEMLRHKLTSKDDQPKSAATFDLHLDKRFLRLSDEDA